MKTFKYKNRLWRWVYVKAALLFRTNNRCKFPKDITDRERVVYDIFIRILHDPDTKLYYDNKTMECSMKCEKQSLWIFLEPNNIKVINSTFGYDRYISPKLECYLSDRFSMENTKRRRLMKEEALSKVEYSLSKTLNKLKTND